MLDEGGVGPVLRQAEARLTGETRAEFAGLIGSQRTVTAF